MLTPVLASEFVLQGIKNRVYDEQYFLLIRDLIQYFNRGVAGVTQNCKGLFDFTINALRKLVVDRCAAATSPVKLNSKELRDVTAVVKLQQKMLDSSKSLATTVKTNHYSTAKADLVKVKTSNKVLNDEFKKLMEDWDMIKGVHE